MSSPIAIFRAVLTAEQTRSSLVEPLAEKRVEMDTLLFIFVGALPLIAVVVRTAPALDARRPAQPVTLTKPVVRRRPLCHVAQVIAPMQGPATRSQERSKKCRNK